MSGCPFVQVTPPRRTARFKPPMCKMCRVYPPSWPWPDLLQLLRAKPLLADRNSPPALPPLTRVPLLRRLAEQVEGAVRVRAHAAQPRQVQVAQAEQRVRVVAPSRAAPPLVSLLVRLLRAVPAAYAGVRQDWCCVREGLLPYSQRNDGVEGARTRTWRGVFHAGGCCGRVLQEPRPTGDGLSAAMPPPVTKREVLSSAPHKASHAASTGTCRCGRVELVLPVRLHASPAASPCPYARIPGQPLPCESVPLPSLCLVRPYPAEPLPRTHAASYPRYPAQPLPRPLGTPD